MTFWDFLIDTIGTAAGWSALFLALAWALERGRRCDLHLHLPPIGGDDGGGRRPVPRPAFPGGRYDASRIYTADEWRARRRNCRLPENS